MSDDGGLWGVAFLKLVPAVSNNGVCLGLVLLHLL